MARAVGEVERLPPGSAVEQMLADHLVMIRRDHAGDDGVGLVVNFCGRGDGHHEKRTFQERLPRAIRL